MNLESDKRLIQLRLDFSSAPTGEARQARREDIESLSVVSEPERLTKLAKGSALDIPSARGTVEHSNKREYPSDVGSAGGTHELLLRTPQGQHSLALSLF
jgi:hypothetical protein